MKKFFEKFLITMIDNVDHPELWDELEKHRTETSDLSELERLCQELDASQHDSVTVLNTKVLYAVIKVTQGEFTTAKNLIQNLQLHNSQNLLVCGAAFYINSKIHPKDPKYKLHNKFCEKPFNRLEILEKSTHQCCASWLPISCGDLSEQTWQEVWHSSQANAVRESILDGSFRYCNKILCPAINGDLLPEKDGSVANVQVLTKPTPEVLNLSYDRTCNLSCPSCRSTKYVADSTHRNFLSKMQNENIFPLLKKAKTAIVTGSGAPFASKIFRELLLSIDKYSHPNLKLILMTNGLLLTEKEWNKFKNLKGMIGSIRVSIDGVSASTHDKIRRGSNWLQLEKNLNFIGQLRKEKVLDNFVLCFVVQSENYHEMGDAVDFAKHVGADQIFFDRMSNWGTFSDTDFKEKSVFMERHKKFGDFMKKLSDPRLRDRIVFKESFQDFPPSARIAGHREKKMNVWKLQIAY